MNNRRRMIDVSSNNAPLNTRTHWRAGHRLLMRKVTEGVGYFWTGGSALARAWHRRTGIVWHYHYLRSGLTGRAQADWFWQHAKGDVSRFDRIVVDTESMGNNWQPGEAERCTRDFIDRIHELAPHLDGAVYSTAYFLKENGVTPQHGWALMVAGYPHVDFVPPGWRAWLAHQFTQAGSVAGIAGGVDVSELRPAALQPTLRRGDRCFAVKDAKRLLRRAGYRGFLPTAGYGSGMARAVAKYKRDHHRKDTSGAVFGAWMWRHLS